MFPPYRKVKPLESGSNASRITGCEATVWSNSLIYRLWQAFFLYNALHWKFDTLTLHCIKNTMCYQHWQRVTLCQKDRMTIDHTVSPCTGVKTSVHQDNTKRFAQQCRRINLLADQNYLLHTACTREQRTIAQLSFDLPSDHDCIVYSIWKGKAALKFMAHKSAYGELLCDS